MRSDPQAGQGEDDAALHLAQGLHLAPGEVEELAVRTRREVGPASPIRNGGPDDPFGQLGDPPQGRRQADPAIGPDAHTARLGAQPVVEAREGGRGLLREGGGPEESGE